MREIFVFGSRYMLGVALEWNNHFKLIDEEERASLADRALGFDFAKAKDREPEMSGRGDR